jgi:hypothetical protein
LIPSRTVALAIVRIVMEADFAASGRAHPAVLEGADTSPSQSTQEAVEEQPRWDFSPLRVAVGDNITPIAIPPCLIAAPTAGEGNFHWTQQTVRARVMAGGIWHAWIAAYRLWHGDDEEANFENQQRQNETTEQWKQRLQKEYLLPGIKNGRGVLRNCIWRTKRVGEEMAFEISLASPKEGLGNDEEGMARWRTANSEKYLDPASQRGPADVFTLV